MSNFITKTILYCITFIFAYIIAIPIVFLGPIKGNLKFAKGGVGFMHTRLNEARTAYNKDVLFIGSSHTYRSFDTEFFSVNGISSMNLGSSGQTPDVTHLLLKEYIDIINPKLVIYEVYPNTIFNQSIGSRIDLISNTESNYFKYLNLNDVGMDEINASILRFWHNLLYPKFKEGISKNNDTYIAGGYVRSHKIRECYSDSSDSIYMDFENLGFHYFMENLELLKSLEKNVILIFAPIPKDTYARYSQKDQIDSIFNCQGIPYFNYNGLLLNDTTHFRDCDHLNHAGVQVFNQKLLDDLIELKNYRTNIYTDVISSR